GNQQSTSRLSSRNPRSSRNNHWLSDSPLPDLSEEFFRLGACLFDHTWLRAMLEGNLVQNQLHSIFRLIAAGNELAGPVGNALFPDGRSTGIVETTMLLEAGLGEAVECTFRLGIGQERRQGIAPGAVGADPLWIVRILGPSKAAWHEYSPASRGWGLHA